jgi:hypothetical protein
MRVQVHVFGLHSATCPAPCVYSARAWQAAWSRPARHLPRCSIAACAAHHQIQVLRGAVHQTATGRQLRHRNCSASVVRVPARPALSAIAVRPRGPQAPQTSAAHLREGRERAVAVDVGTADAHTPGVAVRPGQQLAGGCRRRCARSVACYLLCRAMRCSWLELPVDPVTRARMHQPRQGDRHAPVHGAAHDDQAGVVGGDAQQLGLAGWAVPASMEYCASHNGATCSR